MIKVAYILIFLAISIQKSENQHINFNSLEDSETQDLNEEFKNSPVISSVAVSGQPTELPCNVSSLVRDDSVQLVLWYRDHVATPVYSYDARGGVSVRPKEWGDPKVLNGRAYFRLGGSVGSLVLNSTTKEDEAVYRCRVDFKRQTTTHFRVNLTVVEPILSVRIQDASGAVLVGVAGPYTIGKTPTIICTVTGGDPLPVISWWKNGELFDDGYSGVDANVMRVPSTLLTRGNSISSEEFNHRSSSYSSFSHTAMRQYPEEDEVRSTIQLRPLEKSDLRTTYTCRARNHDLAPTKEASIEIDMNFGPESVEIRGLDGPVSAGKMLRLVCEAQGSRPPATLTWWLDGKQLKTPNEHMVSSSTLEFTPQPSDEGKKLNCRAENVHLPSATIEHSVTLQVLYPPRVSLQPGSSLNLSNIKEGDDVYFDCHVNARPKASKISWMLNGKELDQDLTNGIMVVGESLVLQKVSKKQAGNYSCLAVNNQGSNSSSPISLSVKYAPVCRVEQTDVYGVGRLEKTTVTCRVEANPPASSYRWAFNNTGEFVDIPMSHYAIKRDDGLGQRSDLRYAPISDLDYGTLLCWATNEVGVQKVPCTFTVFPAGKPDAVASCKQFNHTEESVSVVCEPGYGGGMNQSFLLEAWDDGSLRALDRSDVPSLEVTGLRPGTRYTLKVYAENSIGRSQPISFNAFTLTDVAERRTAIGVGKETEDLSPVLGSMIGGISCVIVLVIVGIVLAKLKQRRRNQAMRNGGSAPNKDESFDSGNLRQEITKVDSPLPSDPQVGESDNAPVCDLVSTSQDSMMMSRSQDSSTPLIVNTKASQFHTTSPPFQSSSPQFQTTTAQFQTQSAQFHSPPSSHSSDPYFPSPQNESLTYTKMQSQPLEPASFTDFPGPGSKTLPYRQLRNPASQHPVSYVPVLDYSHLQSDSSWVGDLPSTAYREDKGGGGVGINPPRNPTGDSSSMLDSRRHSSYLRPLHSMTGGFSRGNSPHSEEITHDMSQHRFQMSPTEAPHSQSHLHSIHSSKYPSNFQEGQGVSTPLSLDSQQESSV